MKAPVEKNKDPDDPDIAHVFNDQRFDVPDDLKHDIFAEAERQANSIANIKAAQDNSHTGSRLTARNRWFGIAATVAIAVAVSPLLLNSPESALDTERGIASSVTVATDSTPLSKKQAVRPESEALSSSTFNDSALPEAILEISPAGPTTGAIANHRAASSLNTSEEHLAYRASSDKWINKIRLLIADADTKAAREEYQLFEEQYPEIAAAFKPDFDKQMLKLLPMETGENASGNE